MSAKDVGIRIRVERELRDAFQQACAAENRQASDLLREFMRTYAEQTVNGLQIGLFSVAEPQAPFHVKADRWGASSGTGTKRSKQ
jgi:hypothetical protein